ncbi:hypothetical protein AB0N81_10830 [Streptomyces sp. NPDC093510]|uniref:GNAT family N-acetyltransferase n=1 Tax=Streptomyces sp. NPDC093510 TaxID=3155199 RepID=UPI00341AF132
MRIAFSERPPDYENYIFSYHVWGFLEKGESVRSAYTQGFLPSAYDLSRFYLARSVRVNLEDLSKTGRIRYVERKCSSIDQTLVTRAEFHLSPEWRALADGYFDAQKTRADYRRSRFFEMLDSPLATHVSHLVDRNTGAAVGFVPVLIRDGISQYGIPVYDPAYRRVEIGNHLMAATLFRLRDESVDHCYLGLCYDTRSLYKTRFPGMQFFNGSRWSGDRNELHFLLDHQDELKEHHLLNFPPYVDTYGDLDPSSLESRMGPDREIQSR